MIIMTTAENGKRDLRYQDQHDGIYASLDKINNWMIYGHLTLLNEDQFDEGKRLKKFHLLMRDLAKRFTGSRDLDATAWFLKQEGNPSGKRYHFHFAITNDNLEKTTAETVTCYLTKQWGKIGKSVCKIDPWDVSKTASGIWYLTQKENHPLPYSPYFKDDLCHWKISPLLESKILEQVRKSSA
jgi:hypothetical protein